MVDCKRIQFKDMHVCAVSNFQNVTYIESSKESK